ncbi:MAG: ribonuclease Z [Acidimicrobiales bacterium]
MAIEITLLGTGSPLPSPDRAGPATLVRAGPAVLLVDCGRAVVMRLAAAGVPPAGLSAVLLTHLHSDHVADLGDVVTTWWVTAPSPPSIRIVGPPGTAEVVRSTLDALAPDRRYRLEHHADLEPPSVEVTEVEPGDRLEVAGAAVTVGATDHRPVTPTVGYRVEHDGLVAVLAGDTVPCDGLDALCDGADVYVQSVVRDDLIRQLPSARLQDVLSYHSTVEQAAATAARGGVGVLVLTHYVPPPAPGDEASWRALAAAHFDGRVVLGDDLTTFRYERRPGRSR